MIEEDLGRCEYWDCWEGVCACGVLCILGVALLGVQAVGEGDALTGYR